MSQYAGSDWIERSLKVTNMSSLGKTAANLLGDVFLGIYHLNTHALRKVKWDDKWCIEFILGWHELATVDSNELTRLVVLAHDRMLRVGIDPHTFHHIKISICQRTTREKDASFSERCPTLTDHINLIRDHYQMDKCNGCHIIGEKCSDLRKYWNKESCPLE